MAAFHVVLGVDNGMSKVGVWGEWFVDFGTRSAGVACWLQSAMVASRWFYLHRILLRSSGVLLGLSWD